VENDGKKKKKNILSPLDKSIQIEYNGCRRNTNEMCKLERRIL